MTISGEQFVRICLTLDKDRGVCRICPSCCAVALDSHPTLCARCNIKLLNSDEFEIELTARRIQVLHFTGLMLLRTEELPGMAPTLP